jgi:hypothetical protein
LKDYICDNCGEIIKNRQKKNEHIFCNKDCEKEYKHKDSHEERECPICNKKFECKKSDKQTYCSLDCQIEWQRRFPRTGKDHPCYKQDANHTVICEWCGKIFEAGAYQVSHGRRFCSNECRQSWHREIWSQDEDWKQNRREWAISQMENGDAVETNSGPQIIVNNILKELDRKSVV